MQSAAQSPDLVVAHEAGAAANDGARWLHTGHRLNPELVVAHAPGRQTPAVQELTHEAEEY